MASVLVAALGDLAERDGAPKVDKMPDLRNWWRYGQESFVALRPTAWYMPERVTKVNWLDTFAEMVAVREAIDADPILGTRVDTMVGVEFSLQQRRLDWLLIEHLLEPMIVTTRTYEFDEAAFDLHYNRLEAGLLADTVRLVEFIPLNGFVSSMDEIALPGGVVLRPMTDRQMSRAIQVLAAPAEFSGGPNSVQVSRFHQWAVTREQSYPVTSYKQGMPEHPRPPAFPSLEEPVQRLVTALHVVCGGSVVATRPILLQHDDDFPRDIEGSATLPAVGLADVNRPTLLLTEEHVDAVRRVYEALAAPAVARDRSLQVSLRRFVFAGSKSLPEDRLIDLNICSEALFIKRGKIKGGQKGAPAAEAAGQLLAGDPVLGVERTEIERFFKEAYRLRNAEIHGDHPVQKRMTLLGGAKSEDLARFIEDLARLLGRAIQLVLAELTRPQPDRNMLITPR
ncbi:hypothetical protein [Prauserella endophytica]|uniref:Apea-like HEPN domain-containing protein n=1 Tax=Prauserella endophytica TaxID=1592324 RepID=A0ABY2RU56_9PSEU|nr:hypothetical protein [Prauserella endophytica]TKG60642.1 hypothetical protein FCN18_35045 [Prauserella endophytica]TWE15132.1 hypothetical protein FHX69_7314 [Prauserella muralis]SDU62590.1 hypothetical protein SAMN04489733_7244 [Amycolatopsis keratiniphila]